MVYGKGNSNGMETRVVHFNRMATLLDAMLIARVPIDSNTIEVRIMRTGFVLEQVFIIVLSHCGHR